MKTFSRWTLALLLVSAIGTWAQQTPITAVNAAIGSPAAVTIDASGNVYFSSSFNRVFKVDHGGSLTVVAGNSVAGYSGDGGPAVSAELKNPQGLALDSAGNLYIADSDNNRVRKVSLAGIITTIAGNGVLGYSGDGGPAINAELNRPDSLAIDGLGSLYIHVWATDYSVAVRKIPLANGNMTTVVGDISTFSGGGMAVDQTGTIYVADVGTNFIYKFSPTGASLPGFYGSFGPTNVAVDRAGSLYALDGCNIYGVSSTTGRLTNVVGNEKCGYAGDGGPAVEAQLSPSSLAFDSAGNLYIADRNQRIRRVSSATGIITTIAGNGGPVISSVVSAASFQPGIVSNSWITIQGTNLSSTTDTWANAIVNGKLPTSLDGVSVEVNGASAYIYYVSPNQINAVSPNIPPASQSQSGVVTNQFSVTVSGPSGTAQQIYQMPSAVSETLQPAFFLWPGNYTVATRQDFSWAVKNGTFPGTTTVPAKPGDVMILWGTGFGPTSPAAPVGIQIPLGTTYNTASPVTVTVGGRTAVVYGAALAPGYAGLYQVAIQIPLSLPSGDYPVISTINGAQSPASVLIAVQQ